MVHDHLRLAGWLAGWLSLLTFAVVIIEDEGGKSLAMYDLIKEFNTYTKPKSYISSCTQNLFLVQKPEAIYTKL